MYELVFLPNGQVGWRLAQAPRPMYPQAAMLYSPTPQFQGVNPGALGQYYGAQQPPQVFYQGPQQGVSYNQAPYMHRGPINQSQIGARPDNTAADWTGVASGALAGATMGSTFGPWGTLFGGVIGGAAMGIGALTR